MIDFSSALYLGICHAHRALPPWFQLTTGRPAALEEPPEADRLSHDIARLLGCERAIVARSTLHLFWDLFDLLVPNRFIVYVDAGTYPIARWGIERASAKGLPVTEFPKHDVDALSLLLRRNHGIGHRPVIVADGLCIETGQRAPLADYLALVRQYRGRLIVDDTQAVGILGKDPSSGAPYGHGGGGSAAWHGIEAPELIIGSSLAKAFGAPLGVMAGDAVTIANFEHFSATRVHCSQPSLADIGAAQRALAINDRRGDALRTRLSNLVRHFRLGLRRIGLATHGGLFPVQTLKPIAGVNPSSLHRLLLDLGIGAVLRRSRPTCQPIISFLFSATHTRSEIGHCIDALHRACVLNGVRREMLSIPT